jgi:hypothetical protein
MEIINGTVAECVNRSIECHDWLIAHHLEWDCIRELNVKQANRNQRRRNREELNRERQIENITEVKEKKQKTEVARTNYNDRT